MGLKIARAIAGLCLAGMATTTVAQEQSSNRVAAKTDWSVFVEADPKECWSVSAPKETVNTRDGREVSVRRGDILLFVTWRPGESVAGEVSFTGGYPFAEGSTAITRTAGVCSLSVSPTPLTVPPVPTAATNASMFSPSKARSSSDAVLVL